MVMADCYICKYEKERKTMPYVHRACEHCKYNEELVNNFELKEGDEHEG